MMGLGGRIGSCAVAALVAAAGVLVASDGAGARTAGPIVDTFARAGTDQLWSVDAAGVVVGYGGAPSYGDMTSVPVLSRDPSGAAIVAGVGTTSGDGYWLVAEDSAVFAFGDAEHYGSLYDVLRTEGLPATAENIGTIIDGPVYDIVRHPAGDGYWLAARDGGVFSFGVPFLGSAWAEIYPRGRTAVALSVVDDGSSYEIADNVGNLYRCTGTCLLVAGPDDEPATQTSAVTDYRAMASSLNCVQRTKPDFAGGDLDASGRIDASEWAAYSARVQPWYGSLAAESARFADAVRRTDWPGEGDRLAAIVADWADADARFYAELSEADFSYFFVLRETASQRPPVWDDLRAWLGLPDAETDQTDWCALAAQT